MNIDNKNRQLMSRRDFLKIAGIGAAASILSGCDIFSGGKTSSEASNTPVIAGTPTPKGSERLTVITATPSATEAPKATATVLASKECLAADSAPLGAAELKKIVASVPAEVAGEPLSFADGKYQTFPRQVDRDGCLTRQLIDLGTLGPDVDTIFGIDFAGDIQTGALVIYQPDGKVSETRVVGIKRADLETIQLQPALGGDRFDVYRLSEHGGDPALDRMARLHAINTAHTHQKVIYVGDLGAFETQWGQNEKPFLNSIIRAQRPERLDIIAPNFVSPRAK